MTVGGVCGFWSVKQIMAHLASHEQVLVDVLNRFWARPRRRSSTPTAAGVSFNDIEVEQRTGQRMPRS